LGLRSAILLGGLVLVSFSCGRKSVTERVANDSSSDQILAVVGTEQLTVAEFEAELAQRSQGFPNGYATSEQRARLLDQMIRIKAALAKARASELDREPRTRALVEKLIASRFLEKKVAQLTATNSPVTDAEVTRFYERHPEQYHVPASIRAGVIQFKLSSKAEVEKRIEMQAKAEAVRIKALTSDAVGFARLAQQYSEDQSSRYAGGDMGWLKEGESASRWPVAVTKAALALNKAGEIAPLVATADGFFVVRLTERRDAAVRPLAEVREAVKFQLQRSRQQQQEKEISAELKRGLNIQINEVALQSIAVPQSARTSAPPALPGG
jgi:peptidyl-prolyl cis-trans isomerase C